MAGRGWAAARAAILDKVGHRGLSVFPSPIFWGPTREITTDGTKPLCLSLSLFLSLFLILCVWSTTVHPPISRAFPMHQCHAGAVQAVPPSLVHAATLSQLLVLQLSLQVYVYGGGQGLKGTLAGTGKSFMHDNMYNKCLHDRASGREATLLNPKP